MPIETVCVRSAYQNVGQNTNKKQNWAHAHTLCVCNEIDEKAIPMERRMTRTDGMGLNKILVI